MKPARWQRLKIVLGEVLDLPPQRRRERLAELCGDDSDLYREAADLVELEGLLGDFFERPAAALGLDELARAATIDSGSSTLSLPVPEPPQPRPEAEDDPDGGAIRRDVPGTGRVGVYRLLRRIGRGGMGDVHLAERDDAYRQRVALKVVRAGLASERAVARFHVERQILADLEHPYIARLLDGGTTPEGLPYLVMEHIEGEPIHAYCDRRRLGIRARLALLLKVCEAVSFAHRNLVVHRDLKPSNILIGTDGRPKLLDFGIAKLLDPEPSVARDVPPVAARGLTIAGRVALTPNYASPEQLRGQSVTTASDVYSLGVILYQLLTGRRPYDLDLGDPLEVARVLFRDALTLPSATVQSTADAEADVEVRARRRDVAPAGLRRRLAGDLDAIVAKAMARDPRQRYRSVEQLAEDLRRHLEDRPVHARAHTVAYRLGKLARRQRLGLASAALGLFLVIGASVAITLSWTEAQRGQRRARAAVEMLEELLRQGPATTAEKRQLLDLGRSRLLDDDPGGDPELRAIVAGALGRGYQELGGADGLARQLLEESVALQRGLYPDGHARLVRRLDDLGELVYAGGEPRRAEALFREALAMEASLDGRHTPQYLRILNNLGAALQARGDLARAESVLRQVVALKRRLHGEDDSLVKSLNNLATVLAKRGNHREAEALYRRGLARRLELQPSRRHPEVAASLYRLGWLLQRTGRHDEAEPLLREALDIRREVFGDEHPLVASALNSLGVVSLARGEARQAEDRLRRALSLRRRLLGDDHWRVASSRRHLAAALLELDRAAEAERLARRAVATLRRHGMGWRSADAESVHGACLAALGRHAEAAPLLASGHALLLRERGPNFVLTRQAAERLAIHAASADPAFP